VIWINITKIPWCLSFLLFLKKKQMKRLFESYLESWKVSPNRKPLIIRGARQVGKTYLVDQLGKSSFKYYLKINPEKDTGMKSIFHLNDIGSIKILF